jgi:NAD(P)-dependent dehydrogenase (short-subunit alcohol dehydrogenase family)
MLPLLRQSESGRVVNDSSGAGSLTDVTPGTPAFSSTKAALNMLTIQLVAKLKNRGIKVNAVCPGWIRTEMGGTAAPEKCRRRGIRHNMGGYS